MGKAPTAWYVASTVLLVLAGALIIGPTLFVIARASEQPRSDFVAPGGRTVEAEAAATYYVWAVQNAEVDGTFYRGSTSLPEGAVVRVTSVDSGAELELREHDDVSVSVNNRAMQSVYSVTLPAAGSYRIDVQGEFEPRVVSFGSFDFGGLLAGVFGACGLGIVGVVVGLGGLVLLVTAIVKHSTS